MSIIIERARKFAYASHEGQVRKFGNNEPYINHPARVVSMVADYDYDPNMIAAAWLHDVKEDCGVSMNTLTAEFGPDVARMVFDLSDQAPARFNRTVRKAWEAGRFSMCDGRVHTIKLADLIDNTRDIVQRDPEFGKIYLKEKDLLLCSLMKGDGRLWGIASEQVKVGMELLGMPTP